MLSRKNSKYRFMFGYQAIGSCEFPNQGELQHPSVTVRNAFIDNSSMYCSSKKCDPCIISGIFYEDPVVGNDTLEEFQRVYEETKRATEHLGFAQIQGDDTQLLLTARDSLLIDFRTRRQLIDSIKERRIQTINHDIVYNGLIREMIFGATTSANRDENSEHPVEAYDIRLHKYLSKNYMIAFHRAYFALRGTFDSPARSFFIFTHNQDDIDILNHPLVQALKNVKRMNQLKEVIQQSKSNSYLSNLVPKLFDLQLEEAKGYSLAEFDHSFYSEKFMDNTLLPSKLEPYRLRLCAFIDVQQHEKRWVNFSQLFSGRFVSVLVTDAQKLNSNSKVCDDKYNNYDIQTIYFDGIKVPSLFNLDLDAMEID